MARRLGIHQYRANLAVPWADTSALILIAGGVAGIGFLREAATARTLGIGEQLDGMVLAFTVLFSLVGPIATGLNGTIVPHSSTLEVRSRESLNRHVGVALAVSLVIGVLLSLSLVLTALLFSEKFISHGGVSAATLRNTLVIFGLSPALAFTIRSVIAAHLQALGTVRLPVFSQGMPALFATASIFLLATPSAYSIALSFGIGSCVDMAILVGLLRIHVRPRFGSPKQLFQEARIDLRGMGSLIIGSLVFFLNPVVDLIVAARFGIGEASRVGLGNRIPLGLAALLAGSIGLPMFRKLATTNASHGLIQMKALLRKATKEVALVSALAAGSILILSPVLARLLVGDARAEDIGSVTAIQMIFALGIPVYVVGTMWAQAIITTGGHRMILAMGLSGCAINYVLDLLFGRIWGGLGIAGATVCVYLVNLLVMMWGSSGKVAI